MAPFNDRSETAEVFTVKTAKPYSNATWKIFPGPTHALRYQSGSVHAPSSNSNQLPRPNAERRFRTCTSSEFDTTLMSPYWRD